ncbi:hypothetical protein PG996_014136 [Apiospora saccharicola]|uniref:Uncharacterized protein n=1 Tax=Apiospora saccharicola TaxID=335842 RepID=A0ABR1TI65_9PEZI
MVVAAAASPPEEGPWAKAGVIIASIFGSIGAIALLCHGWRRFVEWRIRRRPAAENASGDAEEGKSAAAAAVAAAAAAESAAAAAESAAAAAGAAAAAAGTAAAAGETAAGAAATATQTIAAMRQDMDGVATMAAETAVEKAVGKVRLRLLSEEGEEES